MSEQKLIPNYGYVPFWGFQWVFLILEIYLINNYQQVNDFFDRFFDKDNESSCVFQNAP